jgi:AcrR family transcriptional regulator
VPKILGESLAAHREQVRAKVFDAMRTLLYTRGFDAITLSGVAAAAGVGRTAIYNHFPDREALLVAFVEHETEQYVTRLRTALARVDEPVEALSVFVRMQLEVLVGQHTPPGRKLDMALSADAYSRMSTHVEPITTELRAILVAGMATGQFAAEDPDQLVSMIMATLSAGGEAETAIRFVLRATGVRLP